LKLPVVRGMIKGRLRRSQKAIQNISKTILLSK
jgi:hypothetical protein